MNKINLYTGTFYMDEVTKKYPHLRGKYEIFQKLFQEVKSEKLIEFWPGLNFNPEALKKYPHLKEYSYENWKKNLKPPIDLNEPPVSPSQDRAHLDAR